MASPAPESKPSDIELPSPEASDSLEVVSYLEAAAELWKSGQTKEAIRFIQRGAEAAEQDGNDKRALSLARLGADLSAASAAASSNGAATNATADKSGPEAAADKLGAVPAANQHPVKGSHPPPLPGAQGAPAASDSSPNASSPSLVPKAKTKESGKDGRASGSKDKDDAPAAAKDPNKDSEKESEVGSGPSNYPPNGPASGRTGSSPARAPVASSERNSLKPKPARSVAPAAPAAPKPSAPPPTAPLSAVKELLLSGVAERVTVKRSALDPNLLVVRPAAGNGAKQSPPGARHAVLVYIENDEG